MPRGLMPEGKEYQKQIIDLVANGYTEKEILRKVPVSKATVSRYKASFVKQLGCVSLYQALVKAVKLGWFTKDEEE